MTKPIVDDKDAFLIGFATGLRSATPLATIARSVHQGRLELPEPLSLLGDGRVAAALSIAGVGEWVVDQLPFTPSRLEARSLLVRATAGAVGAAIIEVANARPWWRGLLLGSLGALAGSFAGYHARALLTHIAAQAAERYRMPAAAASFSVAAVEDAIALALSVRALRLSAAAGGAHSRA